MKEETLFLPTGIWTLVPWSWKPMFYRWAMLTPLKYKLKIWITRIVKYHVEEEKILHFLPTFSRKWDKLECGRVFGSKLLDNISRLLLCCLKPENWENWMHYFILSRYIDRVRLKKHLVKTFQVIILLILSTLFTYVTHDNPG